MMTAFDDAQRDASERLHLELDVIREAQGVTLTVREAAIARVALLERHLAALRDARERYLM